MKGNQRACQAEGVSILRLTKAGEKPTDDFLSYTAYRTYGAFGFVIFRRKLNHVVTADEQTGELVQQVLKKGAPVYTNGVDELTLGNTEKLLLLSDTIKTAFLANGFRPKLTTRYVTLEIRQNGRQAS